MLVEKTDKISNKEQKNHEGTFFFGHRNLILSFQTSECTVPRFTEDKILKGLYFFFFFFAPNCSPRDRRTCSL